MACVYALYCSNHVQTTWYPDMQVDLIYLCLKINSSYFRKVKPEPKQTSITLLRVLEVDQRFSFQFRYFTDQGADVKTL